MNDKIKWCVIGANGIAFRRTIPAIIQDDGSELVAIMDRKPENAKRIGEKFGVPYFTSEEEMLKKVNCDAVYIGTPVMCHYDQAMLSLGYGKHVFVEKPLAGNYSDSRKLVDAFKEKNKHIEVGYMMKFHNLHTKAKSIIEGNGVGKVNNIRMQFTCWYPDIKGAWRQQKALGGGGAIMDLGVHCIELIQYLTGERIADVKAFYSTRTFSYEVEDCAVIIFKTESGILGNIDVNFNIPDRASESKLEIYGDKGYIICNGTLGQEEKGQMKYLYAPQEEYSAQQNREYDKPEEFYGENGNLYLKQIQNCNRIIRSGKPDYFYADRSVSVQSVVDKIYHAEQ